jgi:hypothetical protein
MNVNIFAMFSTSRTHCKTLEYAGQLWTHDDYKINVLSILII